MTQTTHVLTNLANDHVEVAITVCLLVLITAYLLRAKIMSYLQKTTSHLKSMLQSIGLHLGVLMLLLALTTDLKLGHLIKVGLALGFLLYLHKNMATPYTAALVLVIFLGVILELNMTKVLPLLIITSHLTITFVKKALHSFLDTDSFSFPWSESPMDLPMLPLKEGLPLAPFPEDMPASPLKQFILLMEASGGSEGSGGSGDDPLPPGGPSSSSKAEILMSQVTEMIKKNQETFGIPEGTIISGLVCLFVGGAVVTRVSTQAHYLGWDSEIAISRKDSSLVKCWKGTHSSNSGIVLYTGLGLSALGLTLIGFGITGMMNR